MSLTSLIMQWIYILTPAISLLGAGILMLWLASRNGPVRWGGVVAFTLSAIVMTANGYVFFKLAVLYSSRSVLG